MGIFVRAVVTGFGLSLGAALYKRVSNRMGLEEANSEATDPEMGAGEQGEDDCADG